MSQIFSFTIVLTFLICTFHASATSFLAFGDMPYTQVDHEMLTSTGVLHKLANATEHDFIVHVGDMKSGSLSCTNELLRSNYALISNVSSKPFVYTPGDNDWTDCDRETLSPRYDELERLNFIRDNFAVQSPHLPQFKRQLTLPENQAWVVDDVQFLTLHIPGTNNGRRQILLSNKKVAYKASQSRDEENIKWLNSLLSSTRKAAVIFMQADLYQSQKYSGHCNKTTKAKCDGYQLYRETFAQYAARLSYPLLLIHGDTGEFCFTKLANNLWRLNAPGDFQFLDIAKITVTDDKNKPFSVSALHSKAKVAKCKGL
ncbi:hypothetical protein HUZ36_05050 [Pseudoalteromonas sp. McH1-7]|uniref:metallophosphoesterase n=1 Tax=Pseudoalteromonas TaxID=53246 RepID=UPI001591AA96|nr:MULTISPECIES: metallophosphoesterase [Pseudoalteromonas]MDW7548599.1 hypothetical protein [Pseudoalteromonas peptidolytica]NUZ10141.1 hypothetical protein [Pseudoalteromonas sp. McH1-7]USD30660.1 hypothetical protein J8Z24_16895 [Pseudoalteromonas sp. SCSIO 43201]